MNLINSLKNIFFSSKVNKSDSNYIKVNTKAKNLNRMILNNFSISYYKRIFKSNYKKKKESKTDFKIKVNKNKKINNKANQELKPENNMMDKSFFYILKGAVYVIEDWWKNILDKKENKKRILHRNFSNKNYKIFCNTNNLKTMPIIKIKSTSFIKADKDKININTIKNINKNKNYKNYNVFYRNSAAKNSELKQTKSVNLPKNENIFQEQNTFEETLINTDSCFFDFTSSNNQEIKENILGHNNINKYSITKEKIKAKKENNNINQIQKEKNLMKKDLNKNVEKNKVKVNDVIYKNNFQKENDPEKVTIPLDENNIGRTPINYLEQNYEIFKEIKSKIKLDSEITTLIQNNYLLKENPLDESSIYINNSDLKQGELIRNVNVHILQAGIKNIRLKKNCNNSFNSNTILNEDDANFSSFINQKDIYKENTKKLKNEKYIMNKKNNDIQNQHINKNNSKKKFENIYKN